MKNAGRMIIAGLALCLMVPTTSLAQREEAEEAARWFLGFPSWTIQLNGGFAHTGRLLLQAPVQPDSSLVQRALDMNNSFSYGLSVGFNILPRTAVRLEFTRTSGDLDYNDDTGTGSDSLDLKDLGSLSTNVLSLSAIRFMLPELVRITPYAGLGVEVAWWNLDEDVDLVVAGNGKQTQTRWGALALLGMQYRLSSSWALRLEAFLLNLGNPFTGEKSFIPTTGFTIDEPQRVGQSHYRLAVAYTFGRPKHPEELERRRRRRR